ncbi:hypothetical protein Hanom_Chr09g00853281 [Helianthus anomalus]
MTRDRASLIKRVTLVLRFVQGTWIWLKDTLRGYGLHIFIIDHETL